MSKQTANLICLLVAAIWGGGFLATAGALEAFDPFSVFGTIRFIGAAIVSWIVIKSKEIKGNKGSFDLEVSISGVLMYLAFAFQTFGPDSDPTQGKMLF